MNVDPATPEWNDIRKVLVSAKLLDEIARAATGRGVLIDWGEPDALGFYTPTLTYTEPAEATA
jgi:hypothetical protein